MDHLVTQLCVLFLTNVLTFSLDKSNKDIVGDLHTSVVTIEFIVPEIFISTKGASFQEEVSISHKKIASI